jgi:hypothetical protein
MKTLVIDAICGAGLHSIVTAQECERLGLARWTGDGRSPAWVWRREVLEKLELEDLQELYTALRESREDAGLITPTIEDQPTAPVQ